MKTMGYIKIIAPFLVVLTLSGCATLPAGPSVGVLPAKGKPFETFQAEDMTCRQWAEKQTGMSTQEAYEKNTATGAVAGTAIGAGLGAAIGSVSGHAGAGALIGAASGLLLGTSVGSDAGQTSSRELQHRYDNAYIQCMYSYGNQVPGNHRRVATAPPQVVVTAPPPPVPLPEPSAYPPPAEIYVDEAPQFIYSPALNMYVAVEVPYDLVYTGVDYLYFSDGSWYRSPYYNGPWTLAAGRNYPPVLGRYKIDNIRHYRDKEFRRYEHDRTHYDGRFHRPEFHGERQRVERRVEYR